MSFLQAIVLSLVQGISEFLPISSKGHLNLFQHFLGFQPSLSFDIFLNTATLLSVIFYFRRQTPYFLKNLKYIITGSIPAIVVGFALKQKLEFIFSDIQLLPFFFLITAAFLFSSKFLNSKKSVLNYKNALIIGIFQAFALFPGVSRSGSTIFAGLLVGLSAVDAFNFSFCLFIPASLGALILDLKGITAPEFFSSGYLLSFVLTAIVGYFALTYLKKTLVGHKFWYFGVYLLLLSLTSFFLI